MTSLMTSQDHKVGHILKLIYLRQYLSYSFDQKLKMSEMLMAIFLVYSISGITSGKKVCRELKMAAILKIFKILNTASIWPQIWKNRPKLRQKSIFMMMTSSMTSQGGLKVGPLYSFINEITTFFITKNRAKIYSLNFLCIGIMSLWLQLYKYIFMTSLMTSPGNKIGPILKLIYLRQYLSYRQKKFVASSKWRHFENFEILNTASIWLQIWKDRLKLCQKCFLWWWRHRWRHGVASKFLSIIMFRRGWLREQIARAMSRQ